MNLAIRTSRRNIVAKITPTAANNFPQANWALCGTELTVVTVAVILESLQRCTQAVANRAAKAAEVVDDITAKRLDEAVRAVFPQKKNADAIVTELAGTTSQLRAGEANTTSNLGDAYRAVASTRHDNRTVEQRLDAVQQPVLNALTQSLVAIPQSVANPAAPESAQKGRPPRPG